MTHTKDIQRMNALWNCRNPYQGKFLKALCVCSAGLLRSPSIAFHLSNLGFNTRACGVHDYALIEIDGILIEWADIIVFADQEHYDAVKTLIPEDKKIIILGIPDNYQFRDPELMKIIEENWKKAMEELDKLP